MFQQMGDAAVVGRRNPGADADPDTERHAVDTGHRSVSTVKPLSSRVTDRSARSSAGAGDAVLDKVFMASKSLGRTCTRSGRAINRPGAAAGRGDAGGFGDGVGKLGRVAQARATSGASISAPSATAVSRPTAVCGQSPRRWRRGWRRCAPEWRRHRPRGHGTSRALGPIGPG